MFQLNCKAHLKPTLKSSSLDLEHKAIWLLRKGLGTFSHLLGVRWKLVMWTKEDEFTKVSRWWHGKWNAHTVRGMKKRTKIFQEMLWCRAWALRRETWNNNIAYITVILKKKTCYFKKGIHINRGALLLALLPLAWISSILIFTHRFDIIHIEIDGSLKIATKFGVKTRLIFRLRYPTSNESSHRK